jgi:uncharacterized membrane protein YbhN (UPF0104 family)
MAGGKLKKIFSAGWFKPALAVAGVLLASFLIYRTLSNYSWDEVVASASSVPLNRIGLATLFAALSYFCLSWFDWLALRYVKQDIPYPKAALASFVALSLGHNIGFAALSSGAIRYRFYSRWGVSGGDVAKIILFCGITVGLGLTLLAGIAFLFRSQLAAELVGIPRGMALGLGALCMALGAGYVALAALVRKAIRIRGWKLEMPPPRLALAQVAIGPLNFACVAGCLYHVLAGVREVAYFEVAATYVLANSASLLAHAPGGLGVLETMVLYLLPGENVLGALLLFRVIYYLLPLSLGAPLFALCELLLNRKRSRARRRPA